MDVGKCIFNLRYTQVQVERHPPPVRGGRAPPAAGDKTSRHDTDTDSPFSYFTQHTPICYRLGSRLGARVPEHDDLASIVTRDEDLVAVHKNCRGMTFALEVYTLQDVA